MKKLISIVLAATMAASVGGAASAAPLVVPRAPASDVINVQWGDASEPANHMWNRTIGGDGRYFREGRRFRGDFRDFRRHREFREFRRNRDFRREFRRDRREFRRDWHARHWDRDWDGFRGHRRGFYRGGGGYWYNGHRGYPYYRHGYREYNGFWFPAAAFLAGAVITGAINSRPDYVVRDRDYGSAHEAYCYRKYISYRDWDNTYQPFHGPRRQCWSPYLN